MVSLDDALQYLLFFYSCYILGGSELEEIELNHLDGHKGSRPVRIGNGAATHIQLVRMSLV